MGQFALIDLRSGQQPCRWLVLGHLIGTQTLPASGRAGVSRHGGQAVLLGKLTH